MSKLKTIIDEIKDQAVSLKDSIESEKIKQLYEKIENISNRNLELEKENRQLRSLLTRVIEDLEKENRRNRSLLKNLSSIS